MIRNENEYQEAARRLKAEKQRLDDHRRQLEQSGLDASEIKRVMDPLRSFHAPLEEEVLGYERLKRGEFDDLENFRVDRVVAK